MNYKEIVKEDRRLSILRFLSDENDFALNNEVIGTALEQLGHSVANSIVIYDLEFLKEIGLIKIEKFKDFHVATLTRRGLDVAKGRLKVNGVKKRAPGD